jgi:PadR family transcriptional regulator AphA
MIPEIIHTTTGSYVRAEPGSGILSSERDVLDLLAACGEIEASRVMLEESALHSDFFDLSSGLAGAVLLKLSMYRVKTAVLANLSAIKSQRFQELIRESNKRGPIRFFDTRAAAEAWLAAKEIRD